MIGADKGNANLCCEGKIHSMDMLCVMLCVENVSIKLVVCCGKVIPV